MKDRIGKVVAIKMMVKDKITLLYKKGENLIAMSKVIQKKYKPRNIEQNQSLTQGIMMIFYK